MNVHEIEKLIKEAANAYYNSDSPIMSDERFDELVDELRRTDPENKLLSTPGWGSEVQYGHLVKRKHEFLAGSLDKVKIESMKSWIESTNTKEAISGACLSSKLDGISAVAYYDEVGDLKYVLTRGDGNEGLDITANIPSAKIPRKLSNYLQGRVSWVRGELVIKKDNLAEGYANVRNMVAGLVNSAEPGELNNLIEFIAYECNFVFNGVPERIPHVRKAHLKGDFDVVRHICVVDYKHNDFKEGLFNYNDSTYQYPYLTDGVVYQSPDLGEYALKFPTQSFQVKVVKVHPQPSGKGRLIPVIEIEPTWISGSTVTYCSGFNYQQIKDNGIGPGAIIEVTKANEIIPHWVKTIQRVEPQIPTEFEGKELKWNGVHLEFEIDHEQALVNNLLLWNTPHGFSWAKVEAIIKEYDLTSAEKLAKFIDNTPDLSKVISQAFIDRAYEMVNNLKEIKLSSVLQGLNLKGVGESSSVIISNCVYHYYDGSLIDMLTYSDGLAEELTSILPTCVPAKSISKNKELIINVLNSGLNIVSEPYISESDNTDLIPITLTGKLSEPRGKLLEKWKSVAIEVDISKAKYLVTDNPDSQSSKAKKARQLGVEVISEFEFVSKYIK